MRKKELKLIVTFHTTADAMAMEKACKSAGITGRLIPVPRELSAGFGLSWRSEVEDKEKVLNLMKEIKIEKEALHEMLV